MQINSVTGLKEQNIFINTVDWDSVMIIKKKERHVLLVVSSSVADLMLKQLQWFLRSFVFLFCGDGLSRDALLLFCWFHQDSILCISCDE